MITFKGISIHVCDKAPKDKPYVIDPKLSTKCPFCGQDLKKETNVKK